VVVDAVVLEGAAVEDDLADGAVVVEDVVVLDGAVVVEDVVVEADDEPAADEPLRAASAVLPGVVVVLAAGLWLEAFELFCADCAGELDVVAAMILSVCSLE